MLNETRVRVLLVLAALGVGAAVIACGSGTALETPQQKGEVVNETTGLKVSATISAASLSDHAASNLQIAFVATEATQAATVEITNVVLVDGSSGTTVDTLTASTPQVWNGRSYETWNQRVTPGGDLRASYQLTTPSWSTIDGSGSTRTSRSYSTPYKLRVTMRIDGNEIVIESGELRREAPVVT
jgi:hypothetical protein